MISRVAQSCFWLNRYMERVEAYARFIAVNQAFVLDVDLPQSERWRPLVVITGEEKLFIRHYGEAKLDDGESVQEYLIWEPRNESSIRNSVYWARENARTIRETISLEMWEAINGLWLWLESKNAGKLYRQERDRFFHELRCQAVMYHGYALSTMLHEEPLDFMRLGTSLERISLTARILDIKFHSLGPTRVRTERPDETAQWMAILRCRSAVEPFSKRAGLELSGQAVTEFLLFDPHFPFSVLHNMERAWNFLRRIRSAGPRHIGVESAARMKSARSAIRGMKIKKVVEQGIHKTLTGIVNETAGISMALRREFFDPQ